MTSYEQKRQELLANSKKLYENMERSLPESNFFQPLSHFINDLEHDSLMITVLGEFKRGKSSLLNALIQNPILPVDVLPATAAVSEIRHGETEKYEVYFKSGQVEERPLSRHELEDFTFEGTQDHKDINLLKLQLPLPFKNNRTILVDTPGIGDLNDHQLDVTYSYIPRSDLILFVINAASPLSKSEMGYLKETVMKLKHGEIAFVVNYKDRIDEDDWEESEEYIKKKLKKVLGEEPIHYYFLSAKEAQKNPQNEDFARLTEFLNDRLDNGTLANKKLAFYESRLQTIYSFVRMEIEEKERRKAMNKEAIQEEFEKIEQFRQEANRKKKKLESYIRERQREILLITRKSIRHFEENLIEETFEDIQAFHQGDFKGYVENTLPLLLKRKIQSWVNAHTPNVTTLFDQLVLEVEKGLERLFSQYSSSLKVHYHSYRMQHKENIVITNQKVSSNAYFESGLLAGGAAALFMAMGGFMLLPLISLAGFPIINKLLGDRKLDRAKQEVLPQVEKAITQAVEKIEQGLEQYIDETIDALLLNSVEMFEQTMNSYQAKLRLELERKLEKIEGHEQIEPVLQLVTNEENRGGFL